MQTKLELQFHGMRRSGNHAVIGWLAEQAAGVVVHCNNIRSIGADPYTDFAQIETYGIPISRCTPKLPLPRRFRHALARRLKRRPSYVFSRGFPCLDPESIRDFPNKALFIHSYEDRPLCEDANHRLENVGDPVSFFTILLLRDPLNLFASWLRKGWLNQENLNRVKGTWLNHAREFDGATSRVRHPKLCINYNRWVAEASYRQFLLSSLGLPPSARRFTRMPVYAGGSSFTGHSKSTTGFATLGRWKDYLGTPLFDSFVNDDELIEASALIFGRELYGDGPG